MRLIAALDPAAAFDALVAEAERGPARDVALDGLLRAADERARPIFAKIAINSGTRNIQAQPI